MSTEEEAREFLADRNVPISASIVPQDVLFVPVGNVRNVEIFGFVCSLFLLCAGAFLGVMINPDNPLFQQFIGVGILLLTIGIALFVWGVHRKISEWEKKKVPLRVRGG